MKTQLESEQCAELYSSRRAGFDRLTDPYCQDVKIEWMMSFRQGCPTRREASKDDDESGAEPLEVPGDDLVALAGRAFELLPIQHGDSPIAA